MPSLLLATTNPHKLEEVAAVLPADFPLTLVSLADVGLATLTEPDEDQPTFEGNALLKARYYAQHAHLPTLADDSGLEVDALAGDPGVRSARYANVQGPRDQRDAANNAKLLDALADTPPDQRAARFVCALAYVDPNASPPVEHTLRDTFEGSILTPDQADDPAQPHAGRGQNGFGYDPLFLVAGLANTTSAQLTPADKNDRSHRGQATRRWLDWYINTRRA